MTRTFKVLSALLSYPTAQLQDGLRRSSTALIDGEALLPAAVRRQLARLTGELANGDLYDLQERYVLLFDRTRSLSLHLFEHVHGESRDRGQAMIDLKSLYENGGLEIDAAELPDFLPLFLEFLSTQPRRRRLRTARSARAYFRGFGRTPAPAGIALRGDFSRPHRACSLEAQGRSRVGIARRARSRCDRLRGARCRLGG